MSNYEIDSYISNVKHLNIIDQETQIVNFSIRHNIYPKNIFIILFIEIIKKIKYNTYNHNIIKEFELIFHDNQFNIYEVQYILYLFSLIKDISTL